MLSFLCFDVTWHSLGEANVIEEFIITEGKKKVPVAGCRCTKGMLKRHAQYRLVREVDVIHEGQCCMV